MRSTTAFTLVEMLVVLAIIATVAAMSLPMILPLMRRRSIDQATEQVKSALTFARSRAIQTQRMVCVTLLATERAIIVTDYDVLRASSNPPFCAHDLYNYVEKVASPPGAAADVEATESTYTGKAESRFDALKSAAVPNGSSVIEYLPEGCNFDLGSFVNIPYDPEDKYKEDEVTSDVISPGRLGFTYVFLPGGSAWTLPPNADTTGANWQKTTLTDKFDKPCGPIIIGPQRSNANELSQVQIIVYAMTGQVASEQVP